MGRDANEKNNMRVNRPDIANYMDNYNNYYGIVDFNIPEKTSVSGTASVYSRCEHGHDFSQIANKISQWKVDENGIIYCPQCHKEGIRIKPIERKRQWSKSLYDFCQENLEYLYLLDEWDYSENEKISITPSTIGFGSNEKVWWNCPLGHKYDMAPSDRCEGDKCPICSGRRVITGINDFASQYPEILKDWDYEKNTLDPTKISQHTSQSAYWKCHKCGHEWITTIAKRTKKDNPSGCSKCINHGMSRIDMCLYLTIKNQFPTAKYRDTTYGVEYDILVENIGLAIEYDGSFYHRNKAKHDAKKVRIAKENNLSFLRIKEINNAMSDFYYKDFVLYVNTNINVKYKVICEQMLICLRDEFGIPLNICVDDDIVQLAISQIQLRNSENSLAKKFPEITKEWHPILNGDLKPEHIDAHSHTDAWWLCSKCNNEYLKPIHRRTDIGPHRAGGCPYCCGQKRKKGFNDLDTLFPGIYSHWCKELNDEINMDFYNCAPRSIKYTYWKFDGKSQYIQIRSAVNKYKKIIEKQNKC